jgi:hypothetical protein
MGNIYFTDIGDYASKAYAVYAKILSNPVGKVIIDDMKATSRDLTFKPRKQTDIEKYGVCDAGTQALDQEAAAPKGVGGDGPVGIWYKGYPDDLTTPDKDERYEKSNFVTDDRGTAREAAWKSVLIQIIITNLV